MFRGAPVLAVVVCMGSAGAAQAGVYADDLSKCLVKSASPADQKDFVIWAFSAMSAHPDVAKYANFTDEQRTAGSKRVAGLYERLMTVDCRAETIAAVKYEGSAAIGVGFSVLGQVAFRNLMGDAKVNAQLTELEKYVDTKKFEALAAEAGVASKPSK